MSRRGRWFAAITILTVALSACGQSSSGIELDGTQWTLVEMDGQPPLPGRQITIGFDNGEVHGNLGCNSFSGLYSLRGRNLEFGMLMSTLMACVEADLMQQESRLFALMGQVEGAQIVNGRLQLHLSDGGQLLYEAAQ